VTTATVQRSGRAELRLGAVLLALTAAAWALSADRMAGMDAAPGAQLGSIDWFALTWLVMMAAMMLPVLAPMVVELGRLAKDAAAPTLFAAGYLASWVAAGLLGYAAIEGVHSLDPGVLAWGNAGRYVAAGAIAAAGLYQLSAAKDACLRRCRERAAFLCDRWRRGRLGALRMGVEHGGWCVGCSWALMAALFALGVMSLAWMAFVAVLIALEKTLPWGRAVTYSTAAILLALGVLLLAAPDAIPGLTVPGGGGAPMPMSSMN
jgi:predicted metal-binding membrane protein